MKIIKLFLIFIMVILVANVNCAIATDNSLIIINVNKSNISEWKKILVNPKMIEFLNSPKVDILPLLKSREYNTEMSKDDRYINLVFNFLLLNNSKEEAFQFLENCLDVIMKNNMAEKSNDNDNKTLINNINIWLSKHNFPEYQEIIRTYGKLISNEGSLKVQLVKTIRDSLSEDENRKINDMEKAENSNHGFLSICFINDKIEYDCLRKRFLDR